MCIIISDNLAVHRRGSLIEMSSPKAGVVFPVVVMLQHVEAIIKTMQIISQVQLQFHRL